MENASKALIIAGAILISILLISVAILILNSTGSVTDQVGSQADAMAIQTFNGQFTSYDGSGKSMSQIKSLQSVVNSSNATNAHDVTLELPGTPLSNQEKYYVRMEYVPSGDFQGYIETIYVVKE